MDELFPVLRSDTSLLEEAVLPNSGKQPATHTVTFRMEHVSIRYGSRTILKDLNWEVKNGEKWALLGANGSGKSTLAYTLAGHPKYEVDGGEVLLDGQNLLKMKLN